MQILNPEGMYHSQRYYSGLKVGNTIYTAGRIPIDPDGNIVAPYDAAAQTTYIMGDLAKILALGGATLQDIVYIKTLFLNGDDSPAIHEARQAAMGNHRPPHTGIRHDSQSWVENGIRLEIEVIAVVEE
jgi:enamine deaminase RidA (YjgF/YER057c/UK114 family)